MGVYQSGQPIEIFDTFSLDGVETNPTQIVYSILAPDGVLTTFTWPGDPEIANPAAGEFILSLSPPSLPGTYQYDVDATGTVTASRSGNFTVLADVTEPTGDPGWAVAGPCQPWADSQDVWSCCGQPMTTVGEGTMATECAVDMTQYAVEASQFLYELSGRRFSGVCEKTVRPCSEQICGFQVLSRGHIVGGTSWLGSSWSTNDCGCNPLDRVLLSGYPVREITEVKIDGVVVPEANNWRLDERSWLTRIADAEGNVQFWPGCQRLDLADTEEGTFSVTYRYGADVPLLGVHAAAQLGCQFYAACVGSTADCVLPTGVTRLTRQGVTMDKMATIAWFYGSNETGSGRGWQTGLSVVDAFLNAYAPYGARRRPSTWSPDGHKYARPVGA